MIEWNSQRSQLDYEVRVGHLRVKVRGATQEEAVQQARTQLCREMPRFWDVIHELDVSRFHVTCLHPEY